MPPGYDPIRDMGREPSAASASPPPPPQMPSPHPHRALLHEHELELELAPTHHKRLPSADDMSPAVRAAADDAAITGGRRVLEGFQAPSDPGYHPSREELAAVNRQHGLAAQQAERSPPSAAQSHAMSSQQQLQQQQLHEQQYQQQRQQQHLAHRHPSHSPHHPQLQQRPSSSSSSSNTSLHHTDLQHQQYQQQQWHSESRRSASFHDLITASEIVSAHQAAATGQAHGHASSPPGARGFTPSRSLSHQGDEYHHDHHSPHRPGGSSMSRSTSNSSQPALPHRTSSQLYTAPQGRTERSPSMANLLNDGTAGAVQDRPRSGSQSSISSMLSHSHSHPQLPAAAHASSHLHQQHHSAAASAPPAPPSAYSHSPLGHDGPRRGTGAGGGERESMSMHAQPRPGSSTSASWARSPIMNAPLITAATRTSSSPAMGPAQLGLGSASNDRQRMFSHPGLVAGNSHPRSLSASYGHDGHVSVSSSPSGPGPLALHASPSHRFAVPNLPAHRSPESRQVPLPLSPFSGPMIPGRGPTTPGSVWPSALGAMGGAGGSYAAHDEVAAAQQQQHHHHSHSIGAHLAASPRRTSTAHPSTLSRLQPLPPTPGAGGAVPHTPGSQPPTPGGYGGPATPGSRSMVAVTPGFDPRYAEEYFPKRPSDCSDAYAAGRPAMMQASPHSSDEHLHATLDRRLSSAAARRPSIEAAWRSRVSPSQQQDSSRGFVAPSPLPQEAGSPSSQGALHTRRDSYERQPEPEFEPGPRGAIFDPVRGITAVPASRRVSSGSSSSTSSELKQVPDPSTMTATTARDPRRFSESSIGAHSSVSNTSASARRVSMDVLGPVLASPVRNDAAVKRGPCVVERGADHDDDGDAERKGKRRRLASNRSQEHAPSQMASRETVVQADEPDRDRISPRTAVEPQVEAAPEERQLEVRTPPAATKPEPSPAKRDPGPRSAPAKEEWEDRVTEDVEMADAVKKRPSPPRFTPPPTETESEVKALQSNGRAPHTDAKMEAAERSNRSADRPSAPAAAAVSRPPPLRYAPMKRLSAPRSVMQPIGIDEIDEKRRRCRNPLRAEWEREHQTDSREPLDNLLHEYHESKMAARANGGGGASSAVEAAPGRDEDEIKAGLKRAREDDLRDAPEVADHYNKRREVGIQGREESPIIPLRKFNNWVKSVLIGRFTRGHDASLDGRCRARGGRIMELGCGKGGDLKKWDKVNPTSLVGVDIAEISIEQAVQRHRDNGARFPAHFYAFDCFSRALTDVVPRQLVEPGIDTVSLQFCMHYAWENVEKARTMLDNVARYLRIGGTFIGTIPDCDALRNRLYHTPPTSHTFGNRHYSITFSHRLLSLPFGDRYTFYLEDAVENVPEYVVDWPTFETLAQEVGLRCIFSANFAQIYNEMGRGGRRNGEFGHLAERMKVVHPASGELIMSNELWEAVTLYKGFAFEKVG